jgi:ribosomal protein S18 acetylase RimI-like enzyme
MIIRPALLGETEAVLALWRRSGSEPRMTDTVECVSAVIAADHAWLLLAELDGQLAGTVIAGWDGWRGNIHRLAVAPEARRRGIALALVREAEQILAERGALRLSALVLLDHDDAVGFWTSAGYCLEAQMGRFIRDVPADEL